MPNVVAALGLLSTVSPDASFASPAATSIKCPSRPKVNDFWPVRREREREHWSFFSLRDFARALRFTEISLYPKSHIHTSHIRNNLSLSLSVYL